MAVRLGSLSVSHSGWGIGAGPGRLSHGGSRRQTSLRLNLKTPTYEDSPTITKVILPWAGSLTFHITPDTLQRSFLATASDTDTLLQMWPWWPQCIRRIKIRPRVILWWPLWWWISRSTRPQACGITCLMHLSLTVALCTLLQGERHFKKFILEASALHYPSVGNAGRCNINLKTSGTLYCSPTRVAPTWGTYSVLCIQVEAQRSLTASGIA